MPMKSHIKVFNPCPIYYLKLQEVVKFMSSEWDITALRPFICEFDDAINLVSILQPRLRTFYIIFNLLTF
jgi:hypothetical protein